MLEIYLMRHGQTDMNVRHMLQGHTNTHLNREGCEQALNAGEMMKTRGIKPDMVFSSPLKRAWVTASLASGFPMDKIHVDDRLTEMGFGTSEGHPFNELSLNCRETFFSDPPAYVPEEGAESFESVMNRTREFIDEVTAEYKEDPEVNGILVTSHGAALSGMITSLMGQDLKMYWHHHMGNCAINIFRYDYNKERLEYSGFIETGNDIFRFK